MRLLKHMKAAGAMLLLALNAATLIITAAQAQTTGHVRPAAPNTDRNALQTGIRLHDAKRYAEAIPYLDAAIVDDPRAAAGYYYRGSCYYYLREYNRAVADENEALRRQPNYAEALLYRGRSLRMLGRVNEALADLDRCIRLKPGFAVPYYVRGYFYMTEFKTRDAEAAQDFTTAIRLDPSYTDAYWLRGKLFGTHNFFREAAADYRQVIALDAAYPLAYCNLALTVFALGQQTEARRYLNKCYSLPSTDAKDRAYYENELRKYIAWQQQRAEAARRGQGGGWYSKVEAERDCATKEGYGTPGYNACMWGRN